MLLLIIQILIQEVKKRLLEKHTLKAVFSMPNSLFHPVGVNTCIIVFKAHNAHSSNKKKFFGYFKDDGFIKQRNKGRIDKALKWDDIKENKILVHCNYTLTHGHKDSTKTNRKRWVPLNSRAQEIIQQTKKVEDYIFPWNRLAFQSYFYDRMCELHSTGAIENRYRPYDLRHTAISRWLEAQIPVAQVANWAGNSSEIIWQHYVNVTKEYEMPLL